jgi:hypothetical protein
MTSRDKKDVRRVQADFEFEDVGLAGRNARMRRGGDNDRERELPPQGNSSGTRPNGISRRREGFGATLTGENNTATSSNAPANIHHLSSSPPHADRDPAPSE